MRPKPNDPVITVTSTPAIVLKRHQTLREAAQLLKEARIGALLVLDDDSGPLAIISERDVCRALADRADPDEVWAADVMTEEPRYATPSQSIRSVAEEMLATGVRHLPVIEEGEVVGMVAERDVLAVLAVASPSSEELAHPRT